MIRQAGHRVALRIEAMTGGEAGGVRLLDTLEQRAPDGTRLVSLYFGAGTDLARVRFADGTRVLGTRWIMSAPVLQIVPESPGAIACQFGEASVKLTPAAVDLDWLDGLNALVAVRNGESLETVTDWLAYHVLHQQVQAVVLLDRAAPGSEEGFDAGLAAWLDQGPLRMVVLRSGLPLGKPDMPPEQHPYCAPESPGRERMRLPPADPRRAPLGEAQCYELLRERYLARTRAVANIDVCDLIVTPEGGSVFDRACAAENGLLPLTGQSAYPWRVRSGAPIRFGDHICVQFDASKIWSRWCLAPHKAPADVVWRLTRIGNLGPAPGVVPGRFYRCMNLRHPVGQIGTLVPKSALVQSPELHRIAHELFEHKPVPIPEAQVAPASQRGRRAIVTTMKNEGPFILEWLAYHRAIGFDDVLVYTNDCTDGTDTLLELLQRKGIVQHRDNPYRSMDMRPQHAALAVAGDEPVIAGAGWVACIDVDEYINIKTGDGTLDALFAAAPEANLISMTWRLFGNADVEGYEDRWITEQFTRCAPEFAPKPHQAWGFKTLFAQRGLFRKLGVHRPKGLNAQRINEINWINGSGKRMPEGQFRTAWRSNAATYGYDLVQLNHYAVRSVESFLVKRDRGRVNHVERDQGLAYWFRMNNNAEEDLSILNRLARARDEFDRLMRDPEIAAAHAACVAMHRARIAELQARPDFAAFEAEIAGPRMRKLSRMHAHFGANVFLAGPSCIPDTVLDNDLAQPFFFTVERGDAVH